MLVPGVYEAHPRHVGHGRRPVHVGVAHQGEDQVHPLGDESLGQNVGDKKLAHARLSPIAEEALQPRTECSPNELATAELAGGG